MNKLLVGGIALMGTAFTSCAGTATETDLRKEDSKVLVVYYSATGTTEKVAKEIADATGGTLFEIIPEQEYTAADLDWHDGNSRSSLEMNDMSSRPEIRNGKLNLDSIETIFIGYPIWWDQAPRVVNTFIDNNDLKGKKVITFCTSGGSSIDGSTATLRQTYPELDIVQGACLNRKSKSEIESWIKELNIN
ncbi:MAG: flavodoxin [Muribaculaceae bacterium]|nr:flavodoxin [Muribaculaceae bacterium]